MPKIKLHPADRSTRKFSDMSEPTGFVNRTDSTLTWSDSTPDRTLTIAPASTTFDYYIAGKRYNKSASETVQISTAEGLHVIYYDGATLTSQANPTDAQVETAILTKALVAYVYWDATNDLGELLEERHGITMDGSTHRELHFTAGTTYFDGLAIGDISADQDGSADAHAQFSVATGQIFDEDIKHVTNAIGSTTGLEVWYRNASLDWRKDTQSGFSVLNATAGRVYYDNAGTLTEVTDNRWVLYHVFAWNAADGNPITVMGQAEYSTKKAARVGATTEINSLLLGDLPSPEMKAIGTVIFQTKDTYTNSVKARIVTTDEGDDYVDWRTAAVSPSAAAQDHGALSGLADDDHTQYILHSLADAANDFLVASGADTFVKKTLAEAGAILEADIDHGNIQGLNTGADHSFIDQSVVSGASPTFTGTNFTGIPAAALPDAQADDSTKGVATFEADDFDDASGKIDLAVSVTKASTTDSGTATPTAHDLNIVGGEGIDTSGAGAAVTIAGEDASDSNKGVATFDTQCFATASGNVTTKNHGASITVEDPASDEDLTIFFTNRAITVTEMRAVLIGSDSQTVTWTVRHHATDRSNAGNEVVTSGTATTGTTSGSDVTGFNDATIPADSFVWLETTAQGGTVTELHVSIIYSVD